MIPIISPKISFDEVKDELKAVLESGILSKGPRIEEFEKMVADYVGVKHAFTATSCTTALHLSLAGLGIKKGDEVLVSDFTFPATANAVVYQQAAPVLVDIDLETYNIDIAGLEKKITPRTKAIIPVDAFGFPVDMESLAVVAREHNLAVIEDAACAIGASFGGKKSGSVGDAGCFSFHPRKIVTTGEGGMVVTDSDELAETIGILRNHGGVFDPDTGFYRFEAAGFNYRMSELQAVIGISQMKKLDRTVAARQAIARTYAKHLERFDWLRLPVETPNAKSTYQSYVVLLDAAIDRNRVVKKMKELGVETTLGTYALHAQPFFFRQFYYKPGELANSWQAFNRTLTLPLYEGLTGGQVEFIADSLQKAIHSL